MGNSIGIPQKKPRIRQRGKSNHRSKLGRILGFPMVGEYYINHNFRLFWVDCYISYPAKPSETQNLSHELWSFQNIITEIGKNKKVTACGTEKMTVKHPSLNGSLSSHDGYYWLRPSLLNSSSHGHTVRLIPTVWTSSMIIYGRWSFILIRIISDQSL